jgi:alkanesulfonate monooxygenase SsuD/methylene tetrahydromethanopterin reductase-like flavin-dependent oxidoreductase (luciferase family)
MNDGAKGRRMKVWHFTEAAYPHLPPDTEYESIRNSLPNKNYDPVVGADLWHRYLDEWLIAEQLGLGIMVNEHHSTATCINPAAPIIAGILARQTSTAPILILGNPIANRRDPVRVAEEMALVDVLSRGRLVSGLVRGVPFEIAAQNSSPMRMQERFWEAHDLILKAWTTHDGPFSWRGKYFEHRSVNIWPRPYQTPHPPVWLTATSTASAVSAAERGYVTATFLTGHQGARKVFDSYRNRRAELGLETPADRFAYAALVYVAETDEAAMDGAEKLLWYLNSNKVPLHYAFPPGFVPVSARADMLLGKPNPFSLGGVSVDGLIDRGIMFAGNPDSVFQQIGRFNDKVGGFGHLLSMGQAGFLGHDETVRNMTLFAREVLPRLNDLKVEPTTATASAQ